jgi:cation:H+ antiporter
MLVTYEFLIGGSLLLLFGSRAAVRGGAAISRAVGLPPMLIGLLIIPFATAVPELAVALRAVDIGEPDFAAGTVIGSSILNVLLVLGLAALFKPLATTPRLVFRDGVAMILAGAAFFYFGRDGRISRLNAEILFGSLVTFLTVSAAMDWRRAASQCLFARRAEGQKQLGTAAAIALLVFAALASFAGALLLVRGSIVAAQEWNIPKASMSVSVTALGVALPEFYIAAAALMRRQHALAVGSILGANIFNILGVIGAAAFWKPLALSTNFVLQDLPILAASAVLVVPLLNSDWKLSRPEGALLLSSYCAYLAFLALRIGLLSPAFLTQHL